MDNFLVHIIRVEMVNGPVTTLRKEESPPPRPLGRPLLLEAKHAAASTSRKGGI